MLRNREWLARELETRTGRSIAKQLGCPEARVSYWKKKHGLISASKSAICREAYNKRYPNGRRGEEAANWQGGRHIYSGYAYVYAPDHPNARNNRVQEHRLVMEKQLGRYLESNEVVHHLDGDRLNNKPDNLVVKIRGEHVSDHFKASHEVVRLRMESEILRNRINELELEIAQMKQPHG